MRPHTIQSLSAVPVTCLSATCLRQCVCAVANKGQLHFPSHTLTATSTTCVPLKNLPPGAGETLHLCKPLAVHTHAHAHAHAMQCEVMSRRPQNTGLQLLQLYVELYANPVLSMVLVTGVTLLLTPELTCCPVR